MNFAADVRSIEDLREMHAAVCRFRTDAQDALASVDLIVRRAADYLSDQLTFWQAAIRRCEEEVFQANQELKQRQYVGFDGRVPDTTVQEKNLQRAKQRLQHAQEKLAAVRRWMTRLPKQVAEVYEGPARQLAATLEAELPRALAVLERRIQSLEAYAALSAPETPRDSAAPAGAAPTPAPPESESKP